MTVVEEAPVDRQPDSSQAGGEVVRRKAARVREEDVAAVGLAQAVEELGRAGQDLAALAPRTI